MTNKLFMLFDDKLRSPDELVAGPVQNLESIGDTIEDSEAILRKIRQFNVVRHKADYSDFKNFVFFNSALDYFNVTGERIINEFPYAGSSEQRQAFFDSLDNYQRHVVSVWPKSTGHLVFNPSISSSYITVDDVGDQRFGVSQTSILSPGTGSISIEFWAVPPAPIAAGKMAFVYQKISSSLDGVSVYFSGSQIALTVKSSSFVDTVSANVVPGVNTYFSLNYDRTVSPPEMSILTGSGDAFPVLVSSVQGTILGSVNAGPDKAFIGTGDANFLAASLADFSGSIDDLKIWRSVRDVATVTSSFNARVYAQDSLVAHWTFNETGSIQFAEGALVKDHSGKGLHGRIQSYYPEMRSSSSLLPYDSLDLCLTMGCPAVAEYIFEQQNSGSIYDRNSDSIVTRHLPEQFFILEEFKNTDVLKNFMYVIARAFDETKVAIDQFINVLKNDYGRFNQTPDALLKDVAKFFGWEFTGNFLNADVLQYIIGRQVLANTESNKVLDVKLYEIKNEFWKRTLINLMHLYKTKGTRESIESLLRIYGVNRNFVRLKEYGYRPEGGIQTARINSEKSVYALTIGSGSQLTSSHVYTYVFQEKIKAVETRVRFPNATSADMTGSLSEGMIWALLDGFGMPVNTLRFEKQSPTSETGSLIFTATEGTVTLSDVPIFNNRWYNIVTNRDHTSASLEINVMGIDRDEVTEHYSASFATPIYEVLQQAGFYLGSSLGSGSQMWVQEARLWKEPLSDIEMEDHALNFQSYGTEDSNGIKDLFVHWRLDDNVSVDGTGARTDGIWEYTQESYRGNMVGFAPNSNPFKKFLNEYNYIASPEFGWTEEKIRDIPSSIVTPDQAFLDNSLVALEFNLIDALNEDISQIIATLDVFNEWIGMPVNKYRDSYVDLDIARENYFRKLSGQLNFKAFADMLEFFDRSFIDMIRKLIPARATFLGDEFIVESHMLERPKMQWNYRRREPEFEPEGVIKVLIRT